MEAFAKRYYTEDEYLTLERAAAYKSEYYCGEIFAMAGGSIVHSGIAVNCVASLHAKVRGSGCRVFNSDMRVFIPETALYTYPDVSVVCGKPEIVKGDCLTNTTLIIEVLSPSTQDYDMGSKFKLYTSIHTLREYVLISSDRRSIDIYRKNDAGRWEMFFMLETAPELALVSVGCTLALDDVYADIDEFDADGLR